MKKLYLTQENLDCLLEMCRELLGHCISSGGPKAEIDFFEGDLKNETIPWLEVCLVHLPAVLATPNNRAWDMSVRQAYHLQNYYHHPRHVIDYLYREFKDKTAWVKK